jgi:hypothetical protein
MRSRFQRFFIYLTPLIPLSFSKERGKEKRGGKAPLLDTPPDLYPSKEGGEY